MEQSTASVALCHAQKKTWPKSRKLHSFLISGALLKTHQGKVTAETNKASVMFFVFFFFFFKGGNYAMWTIRDGAKDSLLFELNSKTDKAELYRIALMSFTHCVTPI